MFVPYNIYIVHFVLNNMWYIVMSINVHDLIFNIIVYFLNTKNPLNTHCKWYNIEQHSWLWNAPWQAIISWKHNVKFGPSDISEGFFELFMIPYQETCHTLQCSISQNLWMLVYDSTSQGKHLYLSCYF